MSGIKSPITDVLAKLTTMQVINMDNQSTSLFARVWNDQFNKFDSGDHEAFPLPAAFVEVINPSEYNRIGCGFDVSDIVFRIHIGHWLADSADGTFGQDLGIFDLRDNIVSLLSNFEPTGCGALVHVTDQQNYNHKSVYVYEIDFKCHFIDSKGSPYDPVSGKYIDSTPPTDLEIDVEKVNNIPGFSILGIGEYRIPKI
ncbi:hypothetical protein J3L18_00010 [Mucilaginibacter gossypii]|uniref:hypothetical protein n=1 Tax=Mucilaginibacter gossypii TaxID=551996 RepID=UPI000DCDAAAD|nr:MULTISPECIES: hypothetical protein [Mucilaginibacter]QTE37486.1 hypothetical protein J3L18_00010 [Mucilaginibacter gossypii]RAV52312.1 hypothetical protein DIU36_24570 [Mucilaginibacter rubeus]